MTPVSPAESFGLSHAGVPPSVSPFAPASSRDSGELLHGARLAEAEGQAAQPADDLTLLALGFIATSLQLQGQQVARAGARRWHEGDREATEPHT